MATIRNRRFYILAAAIAIAVIVSMALWSRFRQERFTTRTEFLMDTVVEIKTPSPTSAEARDAVERSFREMARINNLLSGFVRNSDVWRINANAGIKPVRVSKETIEVLAKAVEMNRLSEGAFDVTLGPVTSLWGFGTERESLPTNKALSMALRNVGTEHLVVDKRMRTVFLQKPAMGLDLGAIGKGYAVDKAMDILKKAHVKSALVNAGSSSIGSLGQRRGGKPWRVGIADPAKDGGISGVLTLTEGAIGTSADTQRYFIKNGVRYHHILDPKTGMPARKMRSITVVAPTAMDADALSTALFVAGPEKALRITKRLRGVSVFGVDVGGRRFSSDDFPISAAQ